MKYSLENIEEFGIKEQEFSEILKFEPIYTLAQFGNYLHHGDASGIFTLEQFK